MKSLAAIMLVILLAAGFSGCNKKVSADEQLVLGQEQQKMSINGVELTLGETKAQVLQLLGNKFSIFFQKLTPHGESCVICAINESDINVKGTLLFSNDTLVRIGRTWGYLGEKDIAFGTQLIELLSNQSHDDKSSSRPALIYSNKYESADVTERAAMIYTGGRMIQIELNNNNVLTLQEIIGVMKK